MEHQTTGAFLQQDLCVSHSGCRLQHNTQSCPVDLQGQYRSAGSSSASDYVFETSDQVYDGTINLPATGMELKQHSRWSNYPPSFTTQGNHASLKTEDPHRELKLPAHSHGMTTTSGYGSPLGPGAMTAPLYGPHLPSDPLGFPVFDFSRELENTEATYPHYSSTVAGVSQAYDVSQYQTDEYRQPLGTSHKSVPETMAPISHVRAQHHLYPSQRQPYYAPRPRYAVTSSPHARQDRIEYSPEHFHANEPLTDSLPGPAQMLNGPSTYPDYMRMGQHHTHDHYSSQGVPDSPPSMGYHHPDGAPVWACKWAIDARGTPCNFVLDDVTPAGITRHLRDMHFRAGEWNKMCRGECQWGTCDRPEMDYASFGKHIASVHLRGAILWRCDFCFRDFSRRDAMKRHVKTCTKNPASERASGSRRNSQ